MVIFLHVLHTMMSCSVPRCMHFLSPYVTHLGVTGCMPFLMALYNGTYAIPLKQHIELLMDTFLHVIYDMMCCGLTRCMDSHLPLCKFPSNNRLFKTTTTVGQVQHRRCTLDNILRGLTAAWRPWRDLPFINVKCFYREYFTAFAVPSLKGHLLLYNLQSEKSLIIADISWFHILMLDVSTFRCQIGGWIQ